MASFQLDVWKLQVALVDVGLGVRLDGLWHFDTELALGAWVEPVDTSFVVGDPAGSKSITVTTGRKNGVSVADTVYAWTSIVKAKVDKMPPRPPGDPISFTVKELEDYFGLPITGKYGPDLEDSLIATAPAGAGFSVLDPESGSTLPEYRAGVPAILIWATAGDLNWVKELRSDVSTAPPPQPALPPVTVAPPKLSSSTLQMTAPSHLAVTTLPVPNPLDMNNFSPSGTLAVETTQVSPASTSRVTVAPAGSSISRSTQIQTTTASGNRVLDATRDDEGAAPPPPPVPVPVMPPAAKAGIGTWLVMGTATVILGYVILNRHY